MGVKVNTQELAETFKKAESSQFRPRLQHRKGSIIAEAEREMMQPIDLSDPVVPKLIDDIFEDDMEEVPELKMSDCITAACLEGGIIPFSRFTSRKFHRVKNALLSNGPPIDDSWEVITSEEQEEAQTGGKETKKGKSSKYHFFVSLAQSGNEKAWKAKTHATVGGQGIRVHPVEHLVACKGMKVPMKQPTEPPQKVETPKQPAGFDIAPLARQLPSTPTKSKPRVEQEKERQAKDQPLVKAVDNSTNKAVPKSVNSSVVTPAVQAADESTDKPIASADEATTKLAEKTVENPENNMEDSPYAKE